MTQKYLRITMPDNSKWDVPITVIANHRAEYFGENYPKISDKYALLDWAANNMNWEDVVLQAQKVLEPDVDYQEGWINGKKEIIEK